MVDERAKPKSESTRARARARGEPGGGEGGDSACSGVPKRFFTELQRRIPSARLSTVGRTRAEHRKKKFRRCAPPHGGGRLWHDLPSSSSPEPQLHFLEATPFCQPPVSSHDTPTSQRLCGISEFALERCRNHSAVAKKRRWRRSWAFCAFPRAPSRGQCALRSADIRAAHATYI